MRNHGWLLSGVVAVLALHPFGAAAQDDDDDDDGPDDGRGAICSNSLGDVQVRGTLNIASRCRLNGTEVRGDVILFAGGSLIARDARIRGTLEGSRADFVDIQRSRIDGRIDLEELVGDASSIERSDIRGDALLANNRSRFEILNNDFRRDLRAVGNTGGLAISGNVIERDLECSGNDPAPIGLGNRIEGEIEGQCENLRPVPSTSPPPSPSPPPATPPPTSSPAPASAPPPPPAPSPAPPPSSAPPPSAPPTAPPPPTSSPPPTASPPPPAPPPATSPPPAAPPPAEPDPLADEGGAGAGSSLAALLLPLLAWRRFRERRGSGA